MSEYDDDEYPMDNETITPMIARIDASFATNLDGIKYKLYEKTVFASNEESKESQDNAILNQYIQQLVALYRLSEDAQEGIDQWDISGFPEDLHDSIRAVLRFIYDYFKHNSAAKRIPYEHYLRSNLLTNEFVQHMYRRHSGKKSDEDSEEPDDVL